MSGNKFKEELLSFHEIKLVESNKLKAKEIHGSSYCSRNKIRREKERANKEVFVKNRKFKETRIFCKIKY